MEEFLMSSLEQYRRVVMMNFNHTVMATEIQNIQKTENMMYDLYNQMLKELKNPAIKDKIKFIRDQEIGHVKMVTDIITILREHIVTG